MKKLKKGITITSGFMFIFIYFTACTPSRELTKDYSANDPKAKENKSDNVTINDRINFNSDMNVGRDSKNEIDHNLQDNNYSQEKLDSTSDFIEEEGDSNRNNYRTQNYYQRGIATWYGKEFHGRLTASGEKFDMNSLTAAHRMLPFGTILHVKNLENGRNVRVVINDRGPYKDGRILDLSHAAARRLNMITKGEAMVGLKILRKGHDDMHARNRYRGDDVEPVSAIEVNEEEKKFDHVDISNNNYSLQTGAFYSRKNAEKLRKQLEGMFDNNISLVHENDLYKVRVQGLKSRGEARRYKRILEEEDISSYILFNSE